MPIVVRAPTRRMTQAEFGAVAYEVMRLVFAAQKELGRFLDESIYQEAVAAGLNNARTEVPIEITFGEFRTTYYIDLLVADGAVFELKAVEQLSDRHRSQLLHYLLLAELPHGKLINVRPDTIEHEFLNTTLMRADRVNFTVADAGWKEPSAEGRYMQEYLVAVLRDWGTGLELPLYTEALTHFLGGEVIVNRDIEIFWKGWPIGKQRVRLAAPDAAFRVTQLDSEAQRRHFQDHARRFLRHTNLAYLQWINVTLHEVIFRTIHRPRD